MPKFYRNNDAAAENGGGGAPATPAAQAAPVVRGFDALSEITGIENTAAPAAEPAKSPEGTASPVVETPEQIKAREDAAAVAAAGIGGAEPIKLDAEGNQVNEKGEVVKTKAELEESEPVLEFKIPGVPAGAPAADSSPEAIARKEALEALAKESSWTNLAKAQGLEIAENTFDAYEAGIKNKFDQEKTTLLEAAKKQAKDDLLAEKPAEVMAIIEGIEQGFTIEQILQPTKDIEQLEALSNAELIAEDCRLLGWSQDLIDKHIADLTEKDRLDVAAQPLRDILKTSKENIAAEQLERFASLKQSKATKEKEARVRESDEIKNTLVSMKTYMGVPINDQVVGHVQQKWNSGEYHEAFKDPKVIAEFLMYKEFGPQGLKALENRAYQRGRDEKANKLHNLPPVTQVAGKATPVQTVKAEGNFGALPTGG